MLWRERQLDGLKYLLIILVVIGHFIEPSRNNNHLNLLDLLRLEVLHILNQRL